MRNFALSSSNLAGGSYDDENRELTIEFNSGASYVYYGVPVEIVDGLIDSLSPGRFLHLHIRDVYRHRKLV